jgi:hypothetical protein
MKKIFLLIYLLFQFAFLYADLAEDEYLILDKCRNKIFELGDEFEKVLDTYPNISLKGEKKYSNITYKEYVYNGVSFSISAYEESEKNARILRIEVTSKYFATKRGISLGHTREDVIKIYGNADRVRTNKLIYLNREYDHMELIFSFNNIGIINNIELIVGT